jgi:hypothetical protein
MICRQELFDRALGQRVGERQAFVLRVDVHDGVGTDSDGASAETRNSGCDANEDTERHPRG